MKNLKILLCLIISIIFLFGILEGIAYLVESNRLIKEGYGFSFRGEKKPPYPTNIEVFSSYYQKIDKEELFTNVVGTKYKTKPIIIFGDSYSEDYLTEILSRKTKQPVYNFSNAGWGIQHMYYLIKNEEKMATIKNPETLIFVYNSDMKNRTTSFSFYPHHEFLYLKYKIENEKLIEENPNNLFLYNSYLVRALERNKGLKLSYSEKKEDQEKNIELIRVLFEETQRIAKIKYPSIKNFIILKYINPWDSEEELKKREQLVSAQVEYEMWQKIKSSGFIVIETTDISEEKNYNSKEYLEDGNKPKETTIDEITTWLVKKTKI